MAKTLQLVRLPNIFNTVPQPPAYNCTIKKTRTVGRVLRIEHCHTSTNTKNTFDFVTFKNERPCHPSFECKIFPLWFIQDKHLTKGYPSLMKICMCMCYLLLLTSTRSTKTQPIHHLRTQTISKVAHKNWLSTHLNHINASQHAVSCDFMDDRHHQSLSHLCFLCRCQWEARDSGEFKRPSSIQHRMPRRIWRL